MSFVFNNPIIYELRSGTADDPFISKTDSRLIVNNKIILSELPDEFNGITIENYIETKTNTNILSNQFYVNYLNGIIEFNSSENGKTVVANYMGRGIIQIPAERVYITDEFGNPITNFQATATDAIFEENRRSSEIIRISNENTRIFNEDSRVNAESIRQNIEAIRQTNETNRETNESTRQSTFDSKITEVNTAKDNTIIATNNAILAKLNSDNEIEKINSAIISTELIWKEPVATYTSIATTYSSPLVGWTTKTLDTGKRYRYDGYEWVYIDEFSLNELAQNTTNIGDLSTLTTENKSNIVGSINELKNDLKTETWDCIYDYEITITHNLNSYPIALIVGKNTFGHTGYGIIPTDAQYQIFNRLEYIDLNTIRLYLSEEYIGIPTILAVSSTEYNISFDGEDEDLKVFLK